MKKLMTILSLCVAMSLMPVMALAGTQASKTRTARGYSHVMCVAQDTPGICDVAADNTGTDEDGDIYAIVEQYYSVTFTLTEVGTGSSCDIYGIDVNDRGTPGDDDTEIHDTTMDDFADFAAVKLSAAALTLATPNITLSDFDFSYMWVNCTAVGSGSTTVWMSGSQGRLRE